MKELVSELDHLNYDKNQLNAYNQQLRNDLDNIQANIESKEAQISNLESINT